VVSAPEPAMGATTPDRARYSVAHDQALDEILDLARRGRWSEAEQRAQVLYDVGPQR
jgi:hypothetical protein